MLIVATIVVVVAVRFRGSSLENNQLQKPTLLLTTFLELLEKVQRELFFSFNKPYIKILCTYIHCLIIIIIIIVIILFSSSLY